MSQTRQNVSTSSTTPASGNRRSRKDGKTGEKGAHRWALAASVGILFCAFGFPSSFPTTQLPFQLQGHFIVVRGSIGPLHDLNLVIDTGASFTTVSRHLAKRLKLKGESKQVLAYGSKVKVQSTTLPTVKLGSISFDRVQAWVAKLSFPDQRRSLRIDALIGLDFLKRTNLSVDFESQTLRFGSIVHSESSLRFYGGLPFVVLPLQVKDQSVRLLLDTGAQDLILFERRVGGRVRMNKTRETKGIRSGGGTATLRKVHLSEVAFGATSWKSVSAFVIDGQPPNSGIDGILGPASLGLKRLHLDFQQNRISWDR